MKEYITAISIFVSSIIGGCLAHNYQVNTWKSTQIHAGDIRTLNEMKETLDELIVLMLDRAFKLKVLNWTALDLHEKMITGMSSKETLQSLSDTEAYKEYRNL